MQNVLHCIEVWKGPSAGNTDSLLKWGQQMLLAQLLVSYVI